MFRMEFLQYPVLGLSQVGEYLVIILGTQIEFLHPFPELLTFGRPAMFVLEGSAPRTSPPLKAVHPACNLGMVALRKNPVAAEQIKTLVPERFPFA